MTNVSLKMLVNNINQRNGGTLIETRVGHCLCIIGCQVIREKEISLQFPPIFLADKLQSLSCLFKSLIRFQIILSFSKLCIKSVSKLHYIRSLVSKNFIVLQKNTAEVFTNHLMSKNLKIQYEKLVEKYINQLVMQAKCEHLRICAFKSGHQYI